MVKKSKEATPEMELVEYTPEQCGWVRVKQFDRPGLQAYEQPNGNVHYFTEKQRLRVPKLRRKI